MRKRVIGATPREKRDYKLTTNLEFYVDHMNVYVKAIFKGFNNKEFPLGNMYYIKDDDLLRRFRSDQRYIEVFPFKNAPKLYDEKHLKEYHILELCERYKATLSVYTTDSVKILLGKSRVYVFIKIDRGQPTKWRLQSIKSFCKKKGIEWLPADWLIAKYSDLFED